MARDGDEYNSDREREQRLLDRQTGWKPMASDPTRETHAVYPGGPPCAESCPGEWSTYHDGYSWGYESGLAALSTTPAPDPTCGDPEHPLGAYCTVTTGLHTCYPPALSTTPAPDPLREALHKAIDAVLAYGAAPPEYPGLALVPQPDIERLRRIRTAIRVNDHEPHDQSGEPVEGFPTCSGCGAIQTDAALEGAPHE